LFHPKLPLIVSASEDGTVRIWQSTTYRAETTLNYGMDRAWALGATPESEVLAIGFDKGCVCIEFDSTTMNLPHDADDEEAQQNGIAIDSDNLGEERLPRMLHRWTLQGIEHDHECEEDTRLIENPVTDAVAAFRLALIARLRDRQNCFDRACFRTLVESFCAPVARDAKPLIWAGLILTLVLLPWLDWDVALLAAVGLVALVLFQILLFHCVGYLRLRARERYLIIEMSNRSTETI
jgi:hypothetical protein